MSYLTHLAKDNQSINPLYIRFYILTFFLQTSLALDIATVKAEGQLQ